MSTTRIAFIALLLVSALAGGCYRTTITVQGGSGTVPLEHDEAWQHGAVIGLVDITGPHNLDEICPGGTVSVYSETSFLNGLVQALTFNLYNPQTVTITCTQGGEPAAVPAGAETAPAATEATEPAPAAAEVETDLPPPPPPAGQ